MTTGNERRGRGTKRIGTWSTLDRSAWDGLALGDIREVELSTNVRLVVEKVDAQEWRVWTRGGLPTSWLSQFRSVERVRRSSLRQSTDDTRAAQ